MFHGELIEEDDFEEDEAQPADDFDDEVPDEVPDEPEEITAGEEPSAGALS